MKTIHGNEIGEAISDKRRILEITTVTFTGIGKFVFMDILNWKLPFILFAIISWGIYIGYRQYKISGILSYWGFRTDNFKMVALKVLPFGLIAIICSFVVGYFQNTINLTWHIIPILIVYPFWGTVQQFLIIGLVAGNFQHLKNRPMSRIIIIILTAVLFGAVHYPNYWLILGTFILALFYTYIYLKERNVYVLGLFHGWIGGIFYYTVVGRDTFQEVFGKFLN